MTERRTHSFIWGGIIAAALIALSIFASPDGSGILTGIVLGIIGFTFSSCLILDNNFIGEVVSDIFSWGFVQLPGLIFELSLDGILWLITVKLLFWLLGIILAVICGILGVVIGAFLSIFTYPFAIARSFRNSEEC